MSLPTLAEGDRTTRMRSRKQSLLHWFGTRLVRRTETTLATPEAGATTTYASDITRQVRHVSARPVAYGGYADIYSGMWKNGKIEMKVAIKVLRIRAVDPAGKKLLRHLQYEISVWKRLLHPNIHMLCGLYEGLGPAPAMVSPWYANGDINAYVAHHATDCDIETLKFKLILEVLNGLKFLHDHSIVHGDIKGGNVLISDDGTARLCDFGLSRLLGAHSQSITHTTAKGTFRWMAPELLLHDGERHSYESDIWAIGCLLLEVWTALPPYHTKENDQQVFLAMGRKELPARPANITVTVWSLVENCCNFEPADRPTPEQLMENLHARRLIMPRLASLVMCGHPSDWELLTAIATCIPAGDSTQTAKLNSMRDNDLVSEVVRIFSLRNLGSPPTSQLYTDALYRWCLGIVESRPLHDARTATPTAEPSSGQGATDREEDEESRIVSSQLRPFARLLAAVNTGYADTVMLKFARGSALIDLNTGPVSVAWLPDGKSVAIGLRDGTVGLLSTSQGSTLQRLHGHKGQVNHVAVSQDGRLLASCSNDTTVRLWDAVTGNPVGVPMLGHTREVLAVAFSSDGRGVLSASSDRTIRIWSTKTYTSAIGLRLSRTGEVSSVAYSPDGSRIVSGSWDGTLRVWDARTDACLTGPLHGHEDAIYSIAFSPDGTHFASGSVDETVRIWDALTGAPVGAPLEGHGESVLCVTYSPDGTRIASSSLDRTIRVWDVATTAPVHQPLRGHKDAVYSVAFSPDGRWLASVSDDGTVVIWDATDEWVRWDI